jgi:hypothetical protein
MTRFRTVTLMLLLVAAATGRAATPTDREVVLSMFPERLIAESAADQQLGDAPRRRLIDFAALPGGVLAAVYSDGYAGVIRLIKRTADGPVVLASKEGEALGGPSPSIELLDVDGDAQPEIVVSFADQARQLTRGYFIFRSDAALTSLGPSSPDSTDTCLADAEFLDVDGDGVLEVIDTKSELVAHPEEGEDDHTADVQRTLYTLHNGHYGPPRPLLDVESFARGKGKPFWSHSVIVGSDAATATLRLINGDVHGNKRVTSAEVRWNGATILSPADFKRTSRVISVPVRVLPDANPLEVRVDGEPGSELTIVIEPAANASSQVSPPTR